MQPNRRKALALAIFTVTYNLVEGGVAVVASTAASSSALLGFGLDSFVESLSGMVMVWRFWKFDIADENEDFEAVEQRACRLVAYTFFILAAYVLIDASLAIYHRDSPQTSVVGIALAVASLIVMPILFWMKYRLGKQINSPSLVADAKETLACVVLSAALLIGLLAFAIWELWWIDPVAAIIIAILLAREGFETLDECSD